MMRARLFLSLVLASLLLSGGSAGLAAAPDQFDLGPLGTLKLVRDPAPGLAERADKLVLVPGAKGQPEKTVFESDNCIILEVQPIELGGPGEHQFLVTMDPGGASGGFRAFSVLVASGTEFSVAWEGELQMGTFVRRDQDGDGKPDFILEGMEGDPAGGPPATQTLQLIFRNGALEAVPSGN